MKCNLADQIRQAISSVVGSENVPLHEPVFRGNEGRYVQDCIDSTYVSSVGRYVDKFESDIAQFTGSKYAVAVMNGTAALHIALMVAGVKSGDEVIVPALTFAATANAIAYLGATPHFSDSNERSLGLDAEALRSYLIRTTEIKNGQCINLFTNRVIRALVPMHTFGNPSNMHKLLSLAKDFKIAIIEDAAESLGSYYDGVHTGTFGLAGVISFNGNKIITTGGGGVILTNDKEFADRAKHLTTTAKVPHKWEYFHDEVGYNYRMPNLNAALGCAQLEQLPSLLKAKRDLFNSYKRAFKKIDAIRLLEEGEHCKSNYWLQTIILKPNFARYRDEILIAINDAGFMSRPAWTLMHKLPSFRDCPRMKLDVAESLEGRIINIPSSSNIIKNI